MQSPNKLRSITYFQATWKTKYQEKLKIRKEIGFPDSGYIFNDFILLQYLEVQEYLRKLQLHLTSFFYQNINFPIAWA